MRKMIIALTFVFALCAFGASSTNAQTIQPNDGSFVYITVAKDGLNIKLTQNAINFAWTGEGALQLARNVKWYAERAQKVCSAIKVEKLARQIQLHAIAFKAHI